MPSGVIILPSGHECQHDERFTHGLEVLISCLPRVPLRQTKNLHETDCKEYKEDEP